MPTTTYGTFLRLVLPLCCTSAVMPSPHQILLLASVIGAQLGWGSLLNPQQPSSEWQARSAVPSPQGADQPNGTEANPVKGVAGAPDSINSGRQSGPNVNNDNLYTGPTLNLVPGAYVQFKVAVPVGFYVQLDNTPDGGSLITVISPQLPCVKCDTKIVSREMESSIPGYASQEESNPPAYAKIGYSKQQIPEGPQPQEYPPESRDSPASQLIRQQVDQSPTNQPSQINSFPQQHAYQPQPQDAQILPDGGFQLVTHNNPLVPNNPPTLQNYPSAPPNNPPVMQNPSAPSNNPPALQSYPSPLPNNPPAMQNPSAPSNNPPALQSYPSPLPNNPPAMQNPSAPYNPPVMQNRPAAPPNNLPVMQTRPLAPSYTPVIQHFPNTLTRHYYLAPPRNQPALQNFPNSPSEKQDYQTAVRSLDDARKVQEES